jgi:hypothetical protein
VSGDGSGKREIYVSKRDVPGLKLARYNGDSSGCVYYDFRLETLSAVIAKFPAQRKKTRIVQRNIGRAIDIKIN